MAHLHNIYDSDSHFSIDPITRAIKNESSKKTTIIQHDHNSERFTFEMPRLIEGHDMSKCSAIEIHYSNIATNKTDQNKDVYLVDDMQLSPDSEDVVIFSWLLSQNATSLAGTLKFLIRFICINEGKIEYVWHSAPNENFTISAGMNNVHTVVLTYSDAIATLNYNLVEMDARVKAELASKVSNEEFEGVVAAINERIDKNSGGGASSYEYVEMTYDYGEDEDGNYWSRVTDEILELESKALWYKIRALTTFTSDSIDHELEGLFIPDKNLSTKMNKEVFGTFIPTKYGQYSSHDGYEYKEMPFLPSNLTASIFQGDDCSLFEIKGTYMDLEPHEVSDHLSSMTVTIYTPIEEQFPDDFLVGNDIYDGWGQGHFEIWAYVPAPENTASNYSLRREEYTESELAKIAHIEARKAERRARKAEATEA